MTAEIVSFEDYKYTKIAQEFVRLRRIDPIAAARYAKDEVSASKFKILSKYIEHELVRAGEYEPNEK